MYKFDPIYGNLYPKNYVKIENFNLGTVFGSTNRDLLTGLSISVNELDDLKNIIFSEQHNLNAKMRGVCIQERWYTVVKEDQEFSRKKPHFIKTHNSVTNKIPSPKNTINTYQRKLYQDNSRPFEILSYIGLVSQKRDLNGMKEQICISTCGNTLCILRGQSHNAGLVRNLLCFGCSLVECI